MPPAGAPAEGGHELGSRKPRGVGATGRPKGGKERGASCCCDLELQGRVGRLCVTPEAPQTL